MLKLYGGNSGGTSSVRNIFLFNWNIQKQAYHGRQWQQATPATRKTVISVLQGHSGFLAFVAFVDLWLCSAFTLSHGATIALWWWRSFLLTIELFHLVLFFPPCGWVGYRCRLSCQDSSSSFFKCWATKQINQSIKSSCKVKTGAPRR